MHYNPLLDIPDSYKLSHWPQYPQNMTSMSSYFESRGGEFDECTLVGTQYLITEYLSKAFTLEDIDEAQSFAKAHGEPFNVPGFTNMWMVHKGYFPVRIRAIPEGTVVPTGNVLMTVESTDPEFCWVVNYLETMLSRLWYPSTVAMVSREMKKTIKYYLDLTSDTPEADLPFKLHDFGARGVSSHESAMLGGLAHLCNFLGSDTIVGVRAANHYYDCPMAGFSIPATEHSTITSHGKVNETWAYSEYVRKFLTQSQVPDGVPKLAACVIDSYDTFRATEYFTSDYMLPILKACGGTLILRPDSGDPKVVLLKMLDILQAKLGSEVTVNSKGYKVLPPYLRLIQGDGIDRETLGGILAALCGAGWSATNIAFGSGGGLLQKVNRDTQKFAFKCSSITLADGTERDVFKDPVTDPGKKSKCGRLDLVKGRDGEYETTRLLGSSVAWDDSVLETVYENGPTSYRTNLADIRQRMALK